MACVKRGGLGGILFTVPGRGGSVVVFCWVGLCFRLESASEWFQEKDGEWFLLWD